MHRTTLVPRSLWQIALLAFLAALSPASLSHAQDPLAVIITIPAGEFRNVQMSKAQKIEIARSDNPKVVRLFRDPLRPNLIQVKGESEGTTKVYLTDDMKNTEAFDVRVTGAREKSPEEKRKEFLDTIQRAFPSVSLNVLFGPGDTFIVSGNAGRFKDEVRAKADQFLGAGKYSIDFEHVGPQQVQLEVVVAVVNRTEARNMSFSWFNNRQHYFVSSILQAPLNMANTINPGINAAATALTGNPNLIFGVIDNRNGFTGFLQALRTEGLAKVLSEPRIMALSGEKAYINSGGEVPTFATSSLGQAQVTYKAFGTTVEFLPKVLEDGSGRIYLEVHPEISDIDESLRVTLGSNTAPGFRTRRAHVTVVIEDGQTLAIGGLIQNTVNATTTKVPILGDLPFFGAGFRNTSFTEKEEELVIIVTPRLVHPISCTHIPRFLPGRETRIPDDYELFLEGILEAPRGQRTVCFGNEPGWKAAHMNGPSAGLYPCNDSSYSHLGDHFNGCGKAGCTSCGHGGFRGPCRGGLCPDGKCGGTTASPARTSGVDMPTRVPVAADSAVPDIVVETYDPENARVLPAGGVPVDIRPEDPGSPAPPGILRDPR